MAGVTFDFDADTSVEPAGDGRWVAAVRPGWSIAGAPNGGYLVSTILSAMGTAVPDHPDPLAVTAHFPGRADPGPAEVDTAVVRTGRRHATVTGTLSQDGAPRVTVACTYGDLSRTEGPSHIAESRPAFPAPEECVPAGGPEAPGFVQDFVSRFDLRLTPDTARWATARPSGVAEMCGWIRFADGREPDPRCLVLFADAFPPSTFNLMESSWVPTLELTVHVRRRPAPGWVQGRFRTRYLINGYLEEDGELWDANGDLVALSRQLARIR